MRAKTKPANARLTRLGGPQAGLVAAVAVGPGAAGPVLAGTQVGLYRAVAEARTRVARWERLPQAPIGIMALAASPDLASDRTLLAGTGAGIFYSRDGGEHWQAAALPIAGAAAVAFAFSPDYANDGAVLAGTLEDGVLFSAERGAAWQSRSFGVLDSTVYWVAFSPNFANDETAVAGADSTLYLSYNRARAWKALPFPEAAAPVLSVAVSPRFAEDGTLFAGTEANGLFRSRDRGQSWQRLDLPGASINALAWAPEGQGLLAGTEAGLFLSADGGEAWRALLDKDNVVSLAARPGLVVAGLAERGVWLSTDLEGWEPAPNLSARPLVGLALSPQFGHDGVAYLFGPQEALWRTTDGGRTWAIPNEDVPVHDVQALALSPSFARDRTLAAATPAGVLVSRDAGESWQAAAAEPATVLALSPNGRLLAAGFEGGVVRVTADWGQTWQPVPGPWPNSARVAALAVSHNQQFTVAVLEGAQPAVSVWQGAPGQFERVLSEPAGPNSVVALHVPPEPAPDRPWYVGVGHQVWRLSGRRGRAPAPASVFEPGEDADGAAHSLVALTSLPGREGARLLASNGRQLFRSEDGQTWTLAANLGSERAVALAVSPDYEQDKAVYVLLLGGTLARLVIR